MTALPIGLANSKWPHGDPGELTRVANRGIPKRPGLYMNFDTGTNRRLRTPILEALAGKPFAIMGLKRRPLIYFTQAWYFLQGRRYVDRGRGNPFRHTLERWRDGATPCRPRAMA